MKQTNTFIGILLALLMVGIIMGCESRTSEMGYKVDITLDGDMRHDSAALFLLQDE